MLPRPGHPRIGGPARQMGELPKQKDVGGEAQSNGGRVYLSRLSLWDLALVNMDLM